MHIACVLFYQHLLLLVIEITLYYLPPYLEKSVFPFAKVVTMENQNVSLEPNRMANGRVLKIINEMSIVTSLKGFIPFYLLFVRFETHFPSPFGSDWYE